MSTPIRRTAARLAFTGAMTLGSAGLLAGPVLAQYPPDQIDVRVTTPGATITVTGTGWNENTEVTITYGNGTTSASAAAPAPAPAPVTATVDEDGTFTAPIEVPEEAAGSEITYTISGTDAEGQERTETRVLNVQLTSAEVGADTSTSTSTDLAAPAEDGDGGGLLAVAAAGVIALAGGATVARRRVRQD